MINPVFHPSGNYLAAFQYGEDGGDLVLVDLTLGEILTDVFVDMVGQPIVWLER